MLFCLSTGLVTDHDDGDLTLLAQPCTKLEAVEFGKHEIEEHDIRMMFASERERCRALVSERNQESFRFEIQPDDAGRFGIVLHDEDVRPETRSHLMFTDSLS
jgi:hypothetical protein